MRSLPSTGIFLQPELLSIKKVDNYQEFTLKSSINQVNTPAPAPTAQSSSEIAEPVAEPAPEAQ